MNLEKIYVCAWRLEINYLENKNGHGWMRLRWTVCNWGKGVKCMVDLQFQNVGRRLQQQVCHSEEKLWLEGVTMLLIKRGITWLGKNGVF